MSYVTYDETDIQAFEYESTINSDGKILGACEIGHAKIQLLNSDNEYSEYKNKWLQTPLGDFFIEEVKPIQEKINIELSCFDIFHKLDTEYDESLYTFPLTYKNWRNQIFTNCGITYDNSDFPNCNEVIETAPYLGSNPSNRTAISKIAEAGASFVCKDNSDKVYFKWFSNNLFVADDWTNLTTEKIGTNPIEQVVIERDAGDSREYPQTINVNDYSILKIYNNYVLDPQDIDSSTDYRTTRIIPIYNQVKDFSFIPFNMSNPIISNKLNIMLGDKISYDDIYDNSLISYIMTKKYIYLGGALNVSDSYNVILSATDMKEISEDYSYSKPLKEEMYDIYRKIDRQSGEIEDCVKKDGVVSAVNMAVRDGKGIFYYKGNVFVVDADNLIIDQYGNVSAFNLNILGGNILLSDDGTSQNASIKIQTPSQYTDYMIVGDNLDGKKIKFNLKDYTFATLENLRTECIIETMIPGETVRDDDTIYMLYLNAFEDEVGNQFLSVEIEQIGVHTPNIIKTINFVDGKISDNFEVELYDEMGEITGITSDNIINDIKLVTYEVTRETTISGNGIVADIKADYDYTQTDENRCRQIILGQVTPTAEDYRKLDVNKDGIINAGDLLKIHKYIMANIGITRPGKIILNTQDIEDNFVLLDGDGNKKISFGLMSGLHVNDNNIESNESLWYGPTESQYSGLYMTGNQTITLPKKISECEKGIILVWYGFNPTTMTRIEAIVAKQFISKTDISDGVYQHISPMAFTNYQYVGSKLVYVYDNQIVGHSNNTGTGTRNGITFDNTRFVLGEVYAT